jgi:hypothetical protein
MEEESTSSLKDESDSSQHDQSSDMETGTGQQQLNTVVVVLNIMNTCPLKQSTKQINNE